MLYHINFLLSKFTQVSIIVCGMLLISSCGISSLTSSLNGGLFDKQSTVRVKNVTEEQLLNAARLNYGKTLKKNATFDVAHDCPRFEIWALDNAITKYANDQVGDGLAITHRGEITRTARECSIESDRVTVKYGFSGRILLGPKGKTGLVVLPATVFVTDARRKRIAQKKLEIIANVSLDNPISYFSQVRKLTFSIPPGSRPGEFEVFIGFDAQGALQNLNS